MNPEEELKYYKKAYAQEKAARKEAERILETKALELNLLNKKLMNLNANLEQNLIERTEQIKEVEQQYRQLVETANDVIFRVDLKGNFTFINNTGARISGYKRDEIIGKNFTFFVLPQFHETLNNLYQNQLINETESTYCEYQILNRSNEKIWFGQNVQLIYKDGYPIEYIAVARNISERIRSDDALKKSTEKYKKLFEGGFDAVVHLNEKRQFIEWNSKFELLLGYSADELSKMSIDQVLHKEDLKVYNTYADKLKKDGFYTHFIGRLVSKFGKVIDIEVNSTGAYENGIISGSIDNIRDITERISLESAIIRSEEKYRGVIENLEFGLLEVNTQGFIEKAYPSFCKLLGYEEDELIGRNPYELLHPDFHDLMDSRTRDREAGISNVYEVKILKKSGEYLWVIISGAPYYDEHGVLQGSIGVHLDISDQKKMEIELKEANQIAQASSKAKELFLANMSHEIRTPLNAVIGLSSLLKDTDLNSLQTEYATNIYNSAQSLILLVNDILDISKIENGKLEVNNSVFNLKQTLSTILSSSSYLAEKKNLELILVLDERLSQSYLGDDLKLCQILINLLNNAIKFTAFGKVILRIELIAEKNNGHIVEISVEDTGKGIAEDALEVIFEDFSQEDNTILKEYGGTGLGLSISKKLVNILGGELKVRSVLGMGTTFYFRIELEQINDDSELIITEEAQRIDWNKLTILTVEDNPVNQFVIESTIKSWKGKTDIAVNGKEAIEMLSEKKYDLILMDIQMPVMDGITATKIIRQELKLDIPIIAFTANALKKEKERCFAVGANDYISKPFQESQLKSKILNLVLKNKENDFMIVNRDKNAEDENEPFFTTSRIEELSRGKKEFVTRMLSIFSEDVTLQLDIIKNSTDADEISKIAHRVKPSIDYLSNEKMKTLVRQIEQKDFVADPPLLEKFITLLNELILKANAFNE